MIIDASSNVIGRRRVIRLNLRAFCPTGPGGGVDPTCSPGGKQRQAAFSVVVEGDSPAVRQVIADVLGRQSPSESDLDDVAALSGALDGAVVDVRVLKLRPGKYAIHTEISHPDYTASRTILPNKSVENNSLEASKKGSGVGVSVLSAQVTAASRIGVTKLLMNAAGPDAGPGYNGYYTWPRLGYDAELPAAYASRVGSKWPDRSVTRLSDLMAFAEGRDWWKANGNSVDVTFDLNEGSKSRKVLDEYVKERRSRTG